MDNKGFATGGFIHNVSKNEQYIQRAGEIIVPRSFWDNYIIKPFGGIYKFILNTYKPSKN